MKRRRFGLASARRLEIDVFEVGRDFVDRVLRQGGGAGPPCVFANECLPVWCMAVSYAYFTPATWPSAVTKRLQSSR